MAETIKYGVTEMQFNNDIGWRAVWEFNIPDGMPPVTAFAGAHIIFSKSEIPEQYRTAMLHAAYDSAARLVLIPYLSYGREGLKVVVLQTTFGTYPNKARTVNFQMEGGVDFTLASVPSTYLDTPYGREIAGWWIANAFSFITYRATSTPILFPVLWVGAILVKDNMDATAENSFLYLCAIPLDETYSPIQFLFTMPSALFAANYSWRYAPICPTHRGLLVRASEVSNAFPSARITVEGSQGAANPFAIVEVYPSGAQTYGRVKFFNLPDDALSLYLCPEEEFSGFTSLRAPAVLSPYEGKYWVYNASADAFTETNISTQPIALVPILSSFSFDGNTLLGATYQHIYFVAPTNDARVFLAPQIIAYPTVQLPNQQMLIKHGFAPFTELDDGNKLAALNSFTKMFVPPMSIAALGGRAIVYHFDKIFHLDLDSNVALQVCEVKGYSDGVALGIISPCDAYIPQNFIQSLPIFSAFHYARPARPFSCIRVSRPYFLPGTTTTIFAAYMRAAEPGGSDDWGDWGKVIFFERDYERMFEVKNATITYDAQGALYIRFDAPISKEPIAFMVENPPFPYLRVGAPDTRYIIADSIKQPYLFEKEMSGNANGTWIRMGQYITRNSAAEPPYYIRVFVSPKFSEFVRIIAYKAGGDK